MQSKNCSSIIIEVLSFAIVKAKITARIAKYAKRKAIFAINIVNISVMIFLIPDKIQLVL